MIACCAQLFNFRQPLARGTADFAATFNSSAGNEDTMSFLKNLTSLRKRMCEALNTNSPASVKLAALNEYVPQLWRLVISLESQDVPLDKALHFSWRGGIAFVETFTETSDIAFELIMALHAKAMLLNKYGVELLAENTSSASAASAAFREAADIMRELGSNLIYRWSNASRVARPPETEIAVCTFLETYFKACSDQLCVAHSLSQQNTLPSLKAKLCVHVMQLLSQAYDILNIQAPQEKVRCNAMILPHIAIIREYYHVLACLFQAEDLASKEQPGNAMGLLNKVKARAVPQKKGYSAELPGFPKTSDQTTALKNGLREVLENVEIVMAKAKRENDVIYFQRIPKEEDLPDLPKGMSMQLPYTRCEAPSDPPVVLVYDAARAPKTIFGRIGALFKSS